MANPRDELKERLRRAGHDGLLEQTVQKEAAQLPSGKAAPNQSSSSGQQQPSLRQRIAGLYQHARNTPLTVYLSLDTTDSMGFVHEAVEKSIEHIGSELLTSGENIQVAILGVGDHSDFEFLGSRGVHLLGDYGQDNKPTTDPKELRRQARAIVETLGWDQHEAYECFAHDLSGRIEDSLQKDPSQQYTVILFGDAAPHQKKATRFSQLTQGFIVGDAGCPYDRKPEELIRLANAAAHTYFVDCSPWIDPRFRRGTYGVVEQHPKTTYLQFKAAKEFLPEAIIGMVRKVRGPESFEEYLAQLEAGTASKVRGLLGTGKP